MCSISVCGSHSPQPLLTCCSWLSLTSASLQNGQQISATKTCHFTSLLFHTECVVVVKNHTPFGQLLKATFFLGIVDAFLSLFFVFVCSEIQKWNEKVRCESQTPISTTDLREGMSLRLVGDEWQVTAWNCRNDSLGSSSMAREAHLKLSLCFVDPLLIWVFSAEESSAQHWQCRCLEHG